MCCSASDMQSWASDVQSWFHEPFVLPQERCRLLVISALALLAIGLAAYSYTSGAGVYTPGYNASFAYSLWGIAGGVTFCTVSAYIAKAILSRGVAPKPPVEPHPLKDEQNREFYFVYNQLFPNSKPDELPIFSENLEQTVFFDENQPLENIFKDGRSVIRGLQDGIPFMGIRLAIHQENDSKISATLLIFYTALRGWRVQPSKSIRDNICSKLADGTPEALVSIKWLRRLLNKEKTHLLEIDDNWQPSSSRSQLIEKEDGLVVSLWKD